MRSPTFLERQAVQALTLFLPEREQPLNCKHFEGRGHAAGPPGAPDFLCSTNLGIEVTEVMRPDGHAAMATAEMRKRVIAKVRVLCMAKILPIISVNVYFTEHRVSKQDVDELALQLADLICSQLPQPDFKVILHPTNSRFSKYVRHIRISRSDLYGHSMIIENLDWWVDMNAVAALQATIDAKRENHAKYLQHCSRCWLLLWVHTGQAAGAIDLNSAVTAHEYTSPFARTFFWDRWSNKMRELRTHLPAAPK